MIVWRSFGASIIGPGHIATAKPNQDAWAAFHHTWCDGIVLSDGLGSKPFSNLGSEAACVAVVRAFHVCRSNIMSKKAFFLFEQIKKIWLSLVSPLDPSDCAATCLFAFRMNDKMIRMGMLGDGLVSSIKKDGSVVFLSDDKNDGFSNVTAALSPNVVDKDWRWMSIPENDCMALLLCTDGIADDLEDINGFVEGFVGEHRSLSSVSATRRTYWMLENWPSPKHSDDKTIVCLFPEELEQ